MSGAENPDYDGVYVFDNDHPCVGPDSPPVVESGPADVYRRGQAKGVARVVCYGPEHHLRLVQLPTHRIEKLLRCWQEQYKELAARPDIRHVLIFENNGEAVGVSNPHPHCQIYATNFIFKTTEEEVLATKEWRRDHDGRLFDAILAAEKQAGDRIIAENEHAVAFVPWFARYAYEVYVVPYEKVARIDELSPDAIRGYAEVLKEVLVRFDNLWQQPFPYVMAVHNAPTDGGEYADYQMYIALHPPLRKPGLLKYLAGPEVGGGNFIADTWPEDSAAELRAVPAQHYAEEACR